MKRIINLSVHDIVDLLLRKGDIDNRVFNNETMEEGTRLHKIYQDKQGDNYIKEYGVEIEEVRNFKWEN